MIDWIVSNKEWLFSGILIAIPIAIISLIVKNVKISQKQKSGANSTNIQIGGNFSVSNNGGKKDESESKNGR